ncbi:hypothetical protein [Microbacterium suwonense]|uniref:Glycosyl transferase n=1 Tax=Microbacterium suwonense TaxID=683047 RepID=A0ABM8FTM7_9MICO|nr:hypothetical protein [Microbacterium suwonense]BDZ38816.1 glycosyl transferase [Microbacterium suwonense]
MGVVSDGKKAYRLLGRALATRSAAQRVQSTLRAQGKHPEGTYKVAVYFADAAVNMYQMRQWYKPLQKLAERWPVVVLSRNPTGAEKLLQEKALPVAFVPRINQLERFLATQDIRVVLYVNQNTRNFQMFRYGHRWHVFISHGESDKVYMASNQIKSYDFTFIAGQAAHDRLAGALWNYDVDERALRIGRPQADYFEGPLPYRPDERTVVLYSPTWEGDRQSMSYGSVLSHGVTLVEQLLASGRHRVIYRPHPRTGVMDDAYGAANRKIIAMIRAANATDPSAQHVYDDGPEVGWQIAAADVAISDISAMIYDRLATGKPLLVTQPANPHAKVDRRGYLSGCEWLTTAGAAEVVAEVDRVLADEQTVERLREWSTHYFGDTTPGVATAEFHSAIEQLMQKWEQWHARDAIEPEDEDDDANDDPDDEA